MQMYGQHEAGIVSVLGPQDHDPEHPERLRTAGRVLPDIDVAIRDEAGRDLPHGEVGEVCVRSTTLMHGYWKQPELTAEVLRDGWLHTGDIGRLDSDGYLTVVDRLKDMVSAAGGHRVFTTAVEDVLNSHPMVAGSAVFGVQDADRAEHVHAAIVTVPGTRITPDELRALVRERRGQGDVPSHITFLDALPLTDAGKPDKKLLRSQARHGCLPETTHPETIPASGCPTTSRNG
ncbi:hypothetical protein GCM10010442_33930 [Kitasatospora kifunensis]